jgi:sulfoxide reductase heme-binding subunit YedZ
MLVYVAWTLLIGHVLLGALQSERHPALLALTAAAAATVALLQIAAGEKERRADTRRKQAASDGFVPVCSFGSIPEKRATIVTLNGERVAVFRYTGKVSDVSNICRHQNGPLGEGRIIDGCITCPWHGYQYLTDTGMSPPPFDDRVPVYRTRIVDGEIFVHPQP